MAAPHLSLTRLHTRAAVVRRAVMRRRRLLAVLLTVAAVAAGLRAAMPPEPTTVEVVVAARALPAGTELAPDDLATVALPPGAAPEHTVDDPVGSTLAGGVGRGEAITTARLLQHATAAAAPPGHVALPVRLSDPAQADLLRVGMRIDLLATDPKAGTTEAVVPEATVLDTPAPAEGAAGGLTGRVVVLAVPEDLVATVTAATVSHYVTFAWSPV